MLLTAGLAVAASAFLFFGQTANIDRSLNNGQSEQPLVTADSKNLKTFTGDELVKLYSTLVYPNTQPLSEKPTITGNEAADIKIRYLAENMGYRLSVIPSSRIVELNEPGLMPGNLIQPLALVAWQDLKAAAQKENISLQIVAAHRSIEFQRVLFLRSLSDAGINVNGIADGYSDLAVTHVLARVAPPGYSRHHNGYTIDLACSGVDVENFKTTKCYAWLSKNNFENAKKFGWVPSYPDGVNEQRLKPKPWEFIWVGTNLLYE